MRPCLAIFLIALPLAACANRSITEIDLDDAGQPTRVKFGTVLAERRVSARSDVTASFGLGALAGGFGGALLSQTNGGALAGLLIGGLSGGLGHRLAETNNAVEYTIAMQGGETIVLVQQQAGDEAALAPGAPVLVQYGAKFSRVLPAGELPKQVPPPRRVAVLGAKPPPDVAQVRVCLKGPVGESTRESCSQH